MRRRTVLASATVAVPSLLGGCLTDSDPPSEPVLPAGLSVTEEHVRRDVLPESRCRRDAVFGFESVYRVFTEEPVARGSLSSSDVPSGFLAEADVSESAVLVVQYGMQSALWLALERVARADGALDVRVGVAEPSENGGYADDLVVHSLLVGLAEGEGAPSVGTVTVEDPTRPAEAGDGPAIVESSRWNGSCSSDVRGSSDSSRTPR